MRRFALALPLVALSLPVLPVTQAIAQETKQARGTLTEIAGDSVTVKVASTDMKFSYDDKTKVIARGAGTKMRQSGELGKSGPKVAELLQTGQAVEVTYHDMGGTLHATAIRSVATAGSGGVPGHSSNGTVTAVSPTALTIKGSSGGGGTFTQTFTIDSKTKVIGKGIGTASAAKGGAAPVTELVHDGDTVSVSYREEGGALHANDVRVTASKTR